MFSLILPLRRQRLEKTQPKLNVPLIVVGNISVGGTGKTPVIIALAQHLKDAGYKPGVLARGYKSEHNQSRLVPHNASANEFGDEPVMISRSADCPVVVGTNRLDSLDILTQQCSCNIVLSDDGLQHYKMPRSMEIVLVDGERGFGNRFLLPLGPLREPIKRLKEADFVIVNQGSKRVLEPLQIQSFAPNKALTDLTLAVNSWKNVLTQECLPIKDLSIAGAEAIAGIGNPARFKNTLESIGFNGLLKSFEDHHQYSAEDLKALSQKTVLMTEKDAVKCQEIAQSLGAKNWWSLQITAEFSDDFLSEIIEKISIQIAELDAHKSVSN